MLTGDKGGDIIHRSRAVERVHGDEILELTRLKLLQVFLHPCRLKLEGAGGLSVAVEAVGGFIFHVYGVDIHLDTAGLLDGGKCIFDDGKGLESKEVHLDQPCLFDHRPFILRDQQLFFGLFVFGGTDGDNVRNI